MEPASRPERPSPLVRLARAIASSRGQGVVEYGLILSLSAGLAILLLVVFGGTLSAVLDAVGDAIDAAS